MELAAVVLIALAVGALAAVNIGTRSASDSTEGVQSDTIESRLFVFQIQLWGTTARVAAANIDRARSLLAGQHHFSGAWITSKSVTASDLGLDSYDGWEERARVGGGIIAITASTPQPHKKGDTALIEDLRKENRNK